ncbi:GYF domain-containing protein [Flavobacterium sp. LB3P45]|uniref:GYF domain-containing protein n=1 Tax=Flavobacterium fructosi TaxID=3230416 RepID=A0ABW6HLH6_9FLAO
MNTYYIHNGNESTGPFGLDELRSKKITKTTPVWCQGMEDWKYAEEVVELKTILIIIPPPLKSIITPTQTTKSIDKELNTKILGIKKDIFFPVLIVLVLIIGTISFNLFEENRKNVLEQKNKITERNNQQFLIQQREIEEQKIRIAEQERKELERLTTERKQQLSSRLLEIQKQLLDDIRNLEEAKNKLVEANDFEFLRTTDEKSEEISLIQRDIEHWINEIDKLRKEKDQLYLELEKIQPKVSGVTDVN